MKEYELFEPIRKMFDDLGYKVNAEVKDCDITAVKDDEFIIIELKRNLSVALLSQGLNRQKTGADVYIAIPKPKKYSPKKYRDIFYVIKKLELGLIFVNLLENRSYAEIVFYPEPFMPKQKNYRKKNKILNEINGRTVDKNIGGVTGRKIATAYTEKCIHLACILKHFGPMSPSQSKKLGACDNAGTILYNNQYGWFEKVSKGIYKLSKKGENEIEYYPELLEYYSDVICQKSTMTRDITNRYCT